MSKIIKENLLNKGKLIEAKMFENCKEVNKK